MHSAVLSVLTATTRSATDWDEALAPHVYVFYVAFLVAFLFTPIMRIIANTYGIIDRPDNQRKMHTQPVAYLGGIAVFLGWLAGLAVSRFHTTENIRSFPNPHLLISIVIAGIIITLMGFFDDLRRLKPRIKILCQVLAAVLLLCQHFGILEQFQGGIQRNCADPMMIPLGERLHHVFGPSFALPPQVSIIISAVMVICLVVGCCNATNLLDGLDGLCGGVTAVIAAGFLFLAVQIAITPHMLEPDTRYDAVRIVLALALLGGVLGFVPYNFNPASIFMGDAGSMFLGYAVAIMIVLFAQERAIWLLASLVMFALPILDTSLAFLRRWVAHRPLFSADRYHFHHQLVARGLTVRKTVLLSYGLAFGFVFLGGLIAFLRTRYAVAFYLVIFGSIIVAAYKMGMVHEQTRVVTFKPLDRNGLQAAEPSESADVLDIRQPTDANQGK